MKTYTLNELQSKEYKFLDENNQPLKDENEQPVNDIRTYIRIMAKRISKTRRDNAEPVQKAKKIVDEKANQAISQLKTIKDYIPSFVKAKHFTQAEGDTIKIQVESLLQKITTYKEDIEVLNDRIGQGKIRISSVGYTGQGKSTFARLYTGLDELLPVTPGVLDTTGTVVVLNHAQDHNSTYSAVYYSEQDILETVNNYIRMIREKRPNWTVGGKSVFNSIEELCSCRGKDVEIRNINDGAIVGNYIDSPIIEGLSPYFSIVPNNEDWAELLTKKPNNQQVPLSGVAEVLKRINMQDASRYYLATKEVRVCTPFLRNEDLFEDIEIVDTKGGSVKAGIHANKEIIHAIEHSDAVFSIQKTENNGYAFYREVLAPKYTGDGSFRKRHYAIINEVYEYQNGTVVEDKGSVGETKRQLEQLKLCDISYNHCLTDDDAQDFADYVIADMFYHIAKYVTDFDNERIERCNDTVKELNSLIANLCGLLASSYPHFKEDDAIKQQITKMIQSATEYVRPLIEKTEEETTNETDYLTLRNEKKLVTTVYSLITGNQENYNEDVLRGSQDLKTKYNEIYQNSSEIEMETLASVMQVFPSIQQESLPNEEHVGRYIENSASKLNWNLANRINNLTKQKQIGEKERDEIFNSLWTIFKLNLCYAEDKNWENSGIQNESIFFKKLRDIYIEEKYTTREKPLELPSPYDTLREYFKGSSESKDITESVFVDLLRLQSIMAHSLYKKNLHDTIVNMSTKDQRAMQDIAKKVGVSLLSDEQNADSCLAFYSEHKDCILQQEDLQKINLSDWWEEIEKAKKTLTGSFVGLPLLKKRDR